MKKVPINIILASKEEYNLGNQCSYQIQFLELGMHQSLHSIPRQVTAGLRPDTWREDFTSRSNVHVESFYLC